MASLEVARAERARREAALASVASASTSSRVATSLKAVPLSGASGAYSRAMAWNSSSLKRAKAFVAIGLLALQGLRVEA